MNEKQCRAIVRTRSEEMCERCCRGSDLTLHHRRKRSHLPKSRHWEVSNCVMLCGDGVRGCHGWVEHNPKAAAVQGWQVWSWQESAEIPVLYHGNEWVLLTADGKMVEYESS